MHARKALLISITFAGASVALFALLLGLGERFAFRDWPGGTAPKSPRVQVEDEPATAERAPDALAPRPRSLGAMPPRPSARKRTRTPEGAVRGRARTRRNRTAGTRPAEPVANAPAPERGGTVPVEYVGPGPQTPAPSPSPSPDVDRSPPSSQPAPDRPPAREPNPPRQTEPPEQPDPPQQPEPAHEPAAAEPPPPPYSTPPRGGGRPESSEGKKPHPAHPHGGPPGQSPGRGRGRQTPSADQ